MKAITLIDMQSWWCSSHGDEKGGSFNIELYLKYLEIKNK